MSRPFELRNAAGDVFASFDDEGAVTCRNLTLVEPAPLTRRVTVTGEDGTLLLDLDLLTGTTYVAVEDRLDEAARIFLDHVRTLLGEV